VLERATITELNGFSIQEDSAVEIVNRAAVSKPTADAACGLFQLTYHRLHSKYGQAAAAAQDTPVATAALSQSAAQAEIMPRGQLA
jgi:hypothetical protein